MKLIIEDDEGRKTVVPVVREEITIGRQDGNTIKLTERNVSRRHARFFRENGSLMLEDLGSYNGVRVNGEKIDSPIKVKEGDLIEIGDYDLGIQGKLEALPQAPTPSVKTSQRLSGEIPKVAKKETPPESKPLPAAAAEPKGEPAPTATAPAAGGQPAEQAGATAIIRLSDLAKPNGPAEIRDLDKGERPRLVGLNGSFRAKELFLAKTEVKVGRTDDNDLGIDHQSISRSHCRFALEDGAWKVYDNKSANGVRVNGEDYAVSAVKPGDTLELGHVKFRFCAPGERFVPPPERTTGEIPAASVRTSGVLPAVEPPTAKIEPVKKRGSKMPLIAAIAGGALAAAAIAFILLRDRQHPGDSQDASSISAEDAVKQGDTALAQSDFLRATALYEAAKGKGTSPKNLQKAKEEAPAQQAYKELEKAIAANDADKAKAQMDALMADPDRHWAKQATGKAEAVKLMYVKEHLKRGEAARASHPEDCSREATLALQVDPSSEEAQRLAQICKGGTKPAAVVETRREPPAKKEPSGPSVAERNATGKKMVDEGNALYQQGDMDGAAAKYKAAVDARPTGLTLGLAYRGLGSIAMQKRDFANVVKNFELYLPLAPENEKPKIKQIVETVKSRM